MHSGDLAELGGVNLTDIERAALLEVMQRAKVSRLDYYSNNTDHLFRQDFDDKTHKSQNR